MPFIGIIAKESESNFIKNEVTKNAVNNKFEFININKESIQNIKNIKFETVVINEDPLDLLHLSKYLENILKKAKYLIVNSDVVNDVLMSDLDAKIVTYGLNQHAIITVSSIKSENILICVQKDVEDINGKIIEQQEFNIEIEKNSLTKICNSMAIFTILMIYEEKLKKI